MGLGAARKVAHELAAGTENNTGLRRGNQHMPHRLSGEPLLYAVSACLPEVPHPRPAGTRGAGKRAVKERKELPGAAAGLETPISHPPLALPTQYLLDHC